MPRLTALAAVDEEAPSAKVVRIQIERMFTESTTGYEPRLGAALLAMARNARDVPEDILRRDLGLNPETAATPVEAAGDESGGSDTDSDSGVMARVDANLFPSASDQARARTGRFRKAGSGQQCRSSPWQFMSKRPRLDSLQPLSAAAPTEVMQEAVAEVIPEVQGVAPSADTQTRAQGYRELLIKMKAFSVNSLPGSEPIELEAKLDAADRQLSDDAVELIEVILQYLRDTVIKRETAVKPATLRANTTFWSTVASG